MCFRRCQRGAAPRWRGHGHLSLVTGPASRVASLWARRHRFQGSLHTGHPLATLSGPTGRALRAASGPLLRRQLPARWPGGGAGGWPSGPRWHCSPHSGRERCGSRSLSAWLGCGCLGLPATPHLRSCHVRETHLLHLCSASGMGDERPQTLSPYGSQTGKGLQPVHTHSEGPCTTISLCQRGRLGRRLWLSCSAYLSQTPGRGGGFFF